MKRKGKLIRKIATGVLLIVFGVVVILTTVAYIEQSQTYDKLIEEELNAAGTQLRTQLNASIEGDWNGTADNLKKGDFQITDNTELVDPLKSETGIDYTIIYGKTRALTTLTEKGSSKRMTGTDVAESIAKDVLEGGKTAYAPRITIGGVHYYGYYVPLKNSDGSVVGMIFTGRASEDVKKGLTKMLLVEMLIGLIVWICIAIYGISLNKKIGCMFGRISTNITTLAGGHLGIKTESVDLARNDEIGTIAEAIKELDSKLSGIIGKSKDMAGAVSDSGDALNQSSEESSKASEQVTNAVSDISKGAVSQAESVQDAAENMNSMGTDIDSISENVKSLDENADAMKKACADAMAALSELISQNNSVRTSVDAIGETIDSTNESSKKISEFTNSITEIASQTNLLSLNASIEAARAGEAGKGFAVVATEISKLSDESRGSADQITQIVNALIENAEDSVETMQTLSGNFSAQGDKINLTQETMKKMQEAADAVAKTSKDISDKIESLNSSRDRLSSIISDLSAISEENAASSEETNASMQELNSGFKVIADNAEKLQELARQLDETIDYFK